MSDWRLGQNILKHTPPTVSLLWARGREEERKTLPSITPFLLEIRHYTEIKSKQLLVLDFKSVLNCAILGQHKYELKGTFNILSLYLVTTCSMVHSTSTWGKRRLWYFLLKHSIDILCINSANSNAQAKINNTSRKDKGCLSMEHKLFILFRIYEEKPSLRKNLFVMDVTDLKLSLVRLWLTPLYLTPNQIKCFRNFNRDLFLGLCWVFKSTNISLGDICMVRLHN